VRVQERSKSVKKGTYIRCFRVARYSPRHSEITAPPEYTDIVLKIPESYPEKLTSKKLLNPFKHGQIVNIIVLCIMCLCSNSRRVLRLVSLLPSVPVSLERHQKLCTYLYIHLNCA
jgi:hypothetical protein